MMKRLLSIALFVTLSQSTEVNASTNAVTNHDIQYLVNQAQFLAQQGVCQEKILNIFRDNLEREQLNNEKPKSSKLFWSVACCCIVGVVIGGVVYYFFIKKPQPQQPQPQRNNQPDTVVSLEQQNQLTQNDLQQNDRVPHEIAHLEIDRPEHGQDLQRSGALLQEIQMIIQPGENIHNSLIRLMNAEPEQLNQRPLLAAVVEQLRRVERQPDENQNDFITRAAQNIPELQVNLLILG